MTKAEKIIEKIELDILEYVEGRLSERKKIIPLKKDEQIKAIIWNLMTNEKYKSRISLNDYNEIMAILFRRLRDNQIDKTK